MTKEFTRAFQEGSWEVALFLSEKLETVDHKTFEQEILIKRMLDLIEESAWSDDLEDQESKWVILGMNVIKKWNLNLTKNQWNEIEATVVFADRMDLMSALEDRWSHGNVNALDWVDLVVAAYSVQSFRSLDRMLVHPHFLKWEHIGEERHPGVWREVMKVKTQQEMQALSGEIKMSSEKAGTKKFKI